MGGVVATVLAGISHWSTLPRMERGEMPKAARWPLSITVALFVALLGAAEILGDIGLRPSHLAGRRLSCKHLHGGSARA